MTSALSGSGRTTDSLPVRDQVVAWRRYLHQRPELSFNEVETAQFVHDTLAGFGGLEISRPTATSVVARLVTGRPGPVLAMRADMDALAITEETGLPFASANHGVMHACGHDGHTSMLLGAVRELVAIRDALRGELRFIFQHAEEISPGGAEEMVQRGVMEGVDRIIGTHLWASLEVGKVGVIEGAAMAAPDTFWITVRGKGGHAAIPQQTIDAIAVGAQVVTNLQHIVSRATDPIDSVVLSITQFHAGTTHNVIPEVVEMNGTVRSFDPELRTRVPQLMERIIKGVTAAHGATYEFTYERGYRPVINDVEVTREMAAVVEAVCGPDVLVTLRPTMGGEDFSAFLQKAPGSFYFIGAGNVEQGIVHPHHHPKFDIDERALETGVKIFIEAARRFNA
ncbi:MAG TPA: amidohydrolase [Gemmatimonadaceae bacterium]|nr:amidohydrolase [Gemmatimonadaceae bacterium]